MKKSVLVVFVLAAVLSLMSAGCSSGGANAPTTTGNQATNPPSVSSPVIATTSSSASTFTLTMVIEGGGQTTPAAGKYTYPKGTIVNIAAIGDIHWTFNVWLGTVADASSAVTIVTMNSDQSVTAFFSATMD